MATTAGDDDDGAGLAPGDVIASLNGMPILNMQELRKAIREVIGRKPVVLQIERHGRFLYIEPDFDRTGSDGETRSRYGCRATCRLLMWHGPKCGPCAASNSFRSLEYGLGIPLHLNGA